MNISDVVKLFTYDKVTDIHPMGNGHINSTYCVCLQNSAGENYRFIIQKINNYVFQNVDGLMDNICKVTDYLRENLEYGKDPARSVMTVLPSLAGKKYEEAGGEYYRCLVMVEDTITYEAIESPSDFYRCAAAFADFQKRLCKFPAASLCETIADFHNTEKRFENLLISIKNDKCGRKEKVKKEIELCMAKKELAGKIVKKLEDGSIPLRVVHNDTKLNNILFDKTANMPLCIVDLDTVMPGAACYDFSDLIRSGASSSSEDEHDLSKVFLDMELYEACASGFLSVAKDFLTESEIESLVIAPVVITFENALRFLTDYLDGDVYYKISYPDQNLYRCRTHLKLVCDMEQKLPEMQKIIKKYSE